MASFLTALWFTVLAVPQARAAGETARSGLSIRIIPSRTDSGRGILERAGKFSVLFKNQSGQPLHLWSEDCRFGYGTLSFHVEGEAGSPTRMYPEPRSASDWRNKRPRTTTIPPNGTFEWKVAPSQIWGERVWKGVPEPNTGRPVTLQAVYEVKPGKAAREHGVWVGRVTSAPIAVLVVDPKLRTPHEYLEADCPKQALRLLQADRTWIGKRDANQQTPLHLAAHYGYRDVARWLLEHGADVNATAYNRFTPLHFAGDPEMVRLLLGHKADVNARGAGGTALEAAAGNYAHLEGYAGANELRAKWKAITRLLLEDGAEYDIRSACYLGDVARVRALLAEGTPAQNPEAMRIAATYGRGNIVKLLLKHGADPEDAGYGGLTVSYYAIEYANILKMLFDAGANPKVTVEYRGSGHGPHGSTLLHEAARKGALESAKLLLARGLDVNVTTPAGFTPLHEAIGNRVMVEWLLRHGGDAKRRTKDGWTPMGLAAYQVRPEQDEENAEYQAVIRTLERAGVELDVFAAIACDDVRRVAAILKADPKAGAQKDAPGRPALHRAVALGRKGMVKLFLDHRCNPDVRSADKSGYVGETALLEAAYWGRLWAAQLLIQHGANVNARAERGIAPLHEAARMGNLDVARLLLEHGADVNARDNEGLTPLDWAGSYVEVPEMIRLLRSHGGHRKESTN